VRTVLDVYNKAIKTNQILPISLSRATSVAPTMQSASATMYTAAAARARFPTIAATRVRVRATARVNGRLGEMKISRGFSVVAESSEGEESAPSAAAQAEHKLYIGNLSWNSNDEDLKEIFGEFNVVEASVVMDRNTGRSRGFAFVTLSSAEDMERAIAATNGVEVDGRELRVSQAQAPGERPARPLRMDGGERKFQRNRDADNRRVYFGNLSWGMDHLDLQDLCGEFGSVEDSRLITDRETGRSRGFGFVTMSSEAEADEVVAQLNGQDVDGRVLRVNIANSD
jgi:nucleolin